MAGILDLQEQNLPERGGALSVRLPAQWFEALLARMPMMVARKSGRVVGMWHSTPFDMMAHVPIIAAMLRACPGSPEAYLYGPICIAENEWVWATKLFAALRERLPCREGIAFIRSDNASSRRAHAKMGMREVAEYEQEGVRMVAVTCVG